MSEHKKPRHESSSSSGAIKQKLEVDKQLHELTCLTSDLLSTSRPAEKGASYKSMVDPLVNLNMEILAKSSISKPNENAGVCTTAQDLVIQKLTTEVDDLKRKMIVSANQEKMLQQKEKIIKDLKKEILQSRVWIDDLRAENDSLNTQVLMLQSQQAVVSDSAHVKHES